MTSGPVGGRQLGASGSRLPPVGTAVVAFIAFFAAACIQVTAAGATKGKAPQLGLSSAPKAGIGPLAASHAPGLAGTGWAQVPLEGGPVAALAVQGSHLLAGTLAGVFRCSSAGGDWARVSGGLPDGASVSALVPAEGKVWAGTSEGVYASSDEGATWTSAGLRGQPIVFLWAAGGVVLSGVPGGGLYCSGDNGGHWRGVLSCRVFSASAGGSDLLVGSDEGVFRSSDGGLSWSESGLAGSVVLAMAATGQDLLAGSPEGLFLSEDGGRTWAPSGQGLPPGCGVLAFAASGTALHAGTDGAGVFSSTDGGKSWSPEGEGVLHPRVGALANLPDAIVAGTPWGVCRLSAGSALWRLDNHGLLCNEVAALWVSGAILVAGGPGDVQRSVDEGATWLPAKGLPSTSGISALAATSYGLFAGTGGDGVFLSADDGASWSPRGAGLPAVAFVNAILESRGVMYVGTNAKLTGGGPVGGGVYRSSDGGHSWEAASQGLPEFVYVTALAVLGQKLFAATIEGVFTSSDGAGHWAPAAGFPRSAMPFCLVTSGGALYAGTSKGVYIRERDRWRPVRTGLKGRARSVNTLLGDASVLLAGTEDGVYETSLPPKTWKPSAAGMRGFSISALGVASGWRFAGTRGRGLWALPVPSARACPLPGFLGKPMFPEAFMSR